MIASARLGFVAGIIAAALGCASSPSPAAPATAPPRPPAPDSEPGVVVHEVVRRNGYELTFVSKDPDLDPGVHTQLVERFFVVYPREVAEYNPGSLTKVKFVIDPTYDGVAATNAGVVRISAAWFHKHPKDIDVVTHEVMHIVQAYPPGAGPGWITEGIADYARCRFGVSNAAGGWSLPALTAEHKYTTSYRVTARFFVWLEAKVKPGLVKSIDAAMRAHTYRPALWAQLTGKTVDQLWAEYAANPALP
jgi:hypothetical protein